MGLWACGRTVESSPAIDPPHTKSAARPAPEAEAEARLTQESVRELLIRGQGVSLSFPGADGFGPEERVGSWTTRRHRKTGVVLYVLHRPARRTVSPAECEVQATQSLRLLRELGSEPGAEGTFRSRDYFGTASIRLLADRSGYVVVHAAGLARCLSLIFADPRGGERGELELVAEDFFPTVRALSVDDRALARDPS